MAFAVAFVAFVRGATRLPCIMVGGKESVEMAKKSMTKFAEKSEKGFKRLLIPHGGESRRRNVKRSLQIRPMVR